MGRGFARQPPSVLQRVSRALTVSFCVAIGTYNAVGPGASGVLIETYQRGHWTASALPAKELDAAELAQLPITMDGVKCPKAGACVALGRSEV